ncbi:MAG: GYDIA family GHMP kinase [Flavobacteriales bacterium]
MGQKTKSFYAPGKLLISGEYLVLKGAQALAIPVKFGQHLIVNSKEGDSIHWKAKDYKGRVWFEAQYLLSSLDILSSTDIEKAKKLRKILLESGVNLKITNAVEVETKLDFPNDWGLGSSSTLITLVAQWMSENPLDLHFKVSTGSGYDVAVAKEKSAILYSKHNNKVDVEKNNWQPPFRKKLFFIHLNKKQNSDNQVANFSSISNQISEETYREFSDITKNMLNCTELSEFNQLIVLHESKLSKILNRQTIKEQYFSDYTDGEIKSLGAWGGDFVLATGEDTSMKYFLKKNYMTIFSWDEMVFHA